ncbi:MAG: HAD hydrolase family protein [Acidobacteria bacterium]|nr:HAD hydrolase family protein [Acidobacteriota bacterium]
MDCDGVLTDGRIVLLPGGGDVKFFSALDGQGVKLAGRFGLKTGIITTRESQVLERRALEMEVTHLVQKADDKLNAYQQICETEHLGDEQVAYIGDDLPDLSVMRLVGLPIAVANAVPEIKGAARYVTRVPGGSGAVREVVELILRAQGKWEGILDRFSRGIETSSLAIGGIDPGFERST